MSTETTSSLVAQMVRAVENLMRRRLAPIVEDLADVARWRAAVADQIGVPGRDGKDAEPAAVASALLLDERFLRLARGIDGKDGRDGRDGVDGKDGDRGLDGKDGAGVSLDQVLPLLEAGVTKWMLDWERRAQDTITKTIERLPVPKDGAAGIDGRDGRDGVDGKDGADGRDAFALEDFQVGVSGGRTLEFKFVGGGREVFRQVHLDGLQRYVGTFVSGKSYQAGDTVTYGGSMWMAKRDTGTSPPGDDWQLVVKGTR